MKPPLAMLLMVCLAIAGCSEPRPVRQPAASEPLELARTLVFRDVPAPAGFRLVDKEARGRGPGRVALLRYEGGASIDRVEAFFRREMAVGDWHEKRRHELLRERILSYRKGAEHCVITLRRQGERLQVEIRLNNY